tara:strand:+ start:3777 stop:4688 length:912 start_codon:yes stop_codon:yes gene_type:complete
MLPSLSGLRVSGVCQPCAPSTGAVLPKWSDRERQLSAEELARIPDSYNASRVECAICFEQLSDPSPQDGTSREVIVAVDSADSCGHGFHMKCLQRWFDDQVNRAGALACPLCKQPFLDKKIDELYQRVNGARPPAVEAGDRLQRNRQPQNLRRLGLHRRREIPWYPTLFADARWNDGMGDGANWRLIFFDGTLEPVTIRIPDDQHDRWVEYTHEVFCRRFTVDPARLTRAIWSQILTQPENRQAMWIGYHLLVSTLRAAPGAAAAAAAGVRDSVLALGRDVQEARAEGASWREVVLALALGRE